MPAGFIRSGGEGEGKGGERNGKGQVGHKGRKVGGKFGTGPPIG